MDFGERKDWAPWQLFQIAIERSHGKRTEFTPFPRFMLREKRNSQKGNFGQYQQKVKKQQQENPSCLKRMGTACKYSKQRPQPSCHTRQGDSAIGWKALKWDKCLINSPLTLKARDLVEHFNLQIQKQRVSFNNVNSPYWVTWVSLSLSPSPPPFSSPFPSLPHLNKL